MEEVDFGIQYRKCYLKRHGNFESGVRRKQLGAGNDGVDADSGRSDQSAESRGSFSEDLRSRCCGQVLAEVSESCNSPEDLAIDE